jgi:hypothetical protein
MITLLASIVGFVSSVFPEILRIIKDKHDKKHALEILDRKMKLSKVKENMVLQEIEIKKDVLEQAALYSTYKTGISWIDAMNGTVRPVLAYSFFIMYLGMKVLQYLAIKGHQGQLAEYLQVLWNIDDQAIFAGIISFYFGQRTFNKLLKYK